ncbi:MAG: polysaccharide biosynthesis tyrosine autokinase [Candidatus Promineifilaceae bacterium]
MEIREFLIPIRKWWWLIIATTIVASLVGLFIAKQQPQQFQTKATVQIGQSIIDDPNPVTSVLWVSQQLALTYADISRRTPVRTATMEALGLDTLPEYSTRSVPDTQLMEIVVVDTNAERAAAVANEIADQLILQSPTSVEQDEKARQTFINAQLDRLESQITLVEVEVTEKQEELGDLFSARQIAETEDEISDLQTRLADLQTTYGQLIANSKRGAVNSLTLVEPAFVPSDPIGPNINLLTLLAGFIGLVVSTSVTYLIEYMDDSIRTPDDVSRVSGLPALAGIAKIKADSEDDRLITISHPRSPISEAYRVLRTGIQFSAIDAPENSIVMVTSPNPSEGKSLTVGNLGVVMAQAGKNVLIIDADLRRPRQHQVFGVARNHGLTNLMLEYNVNDSEAATLALFKRFIQKPSSGVSGLHILASGPIPPNPSELLGSAKMRALLRKLSAQFDTILLDSPPALAVTDAVLMSTQADGVLLVLDTGRTKKAHLQQVNEMLTEVGARIIGTVLNRLSPRGDGYYYYYYYQNAYYLDESEAERNVVTTKGNGHSKSPTNGNGSLRKRISMSSSKEQGPSEN